MLGFRKRERILSIFIIKIVFNSKKVIGKTTLKNANTKYKIINLL